MKTLTVTLLLLVTIEITGMASELPASSTRDSDDRIPGGPPPSTLRLPASISEILQVEGVPPNMIVSNLAGNEAEVSIAINPRDIRNAVVFGHDPGTGMSSFSTLDGGQTWRLVTFDQPLDGIANCNRTDPTVAFDANGNVYIAYFTFNCTGNNTRTLIVARSTDGGQTYPQIVQALVDPTGQLDKEILATGRDPNNANQQNVYVAYRLDVDEDNNGTAEDVQIHVLASYDGGLTFPIDRLINDDSGGAADDRATFGTPYVGPNGELYVVWDDFSNQPNTSRVMFDRSTDGGTNWGGDVQITTTAVTRGNGNGIVVNNPPRYHIPAQPDRGVLTVPSIAVDRSGGVNNGRIYVTYTDVGPGGAFDTDVMLRFSDNQGANWSAALRVNDDTGTNSQFLPWVSADSAPGSGGRVAVGWYDARNDPNNRRVQTFLAISDNGGQTFRPNIQMAAGQSDQSLNNPNRNLGNYLEYIGVAIHSNRVCMVWSDNSQNLADLDFVTACLFAIDVPVITVPGDVFIADTCLGTTNIGTLYVCNTGSANLEVGAITSSNPRFRVVPPSSGFPVVISPDFCFPFRVQFAPTAPGDQSTTFSIPSNDPLRPTTLVQGFGKGVRPTVTVFMANAGNFGEVCLGQFRDLNLTVNNAGGCPLVISDIDSSSGQFIVPQVVNLPIVVHAGDSVAIPIRFQPTTLGGHLGTIVLESNDPSAPNRFFSVNGQAPPGDVRVTGSTDFGEVCAGTLAEKTISICNVGKCNLLVTNVAFNPPCADFTLINNPFPAVVSPDSCMDVVIRYTPTSCGDHTCNLVIRTDDPDTPVINLTVTASTPCASIDVPPDMAFPPTVISSFGPCRSLLPFPISNTGTCPLWITDIQIGGPQAAEYSLVGLPSFPIILEQGHIVGAGDLSIAFSPAVLARERHATITVTYVIDPVAGTTASVTRELCGEGVHTGARVLVMQGNIPVPKVEKIQLQRINANRNKDPLDTHDNVMDATLVTVIPGLPCEPFQYHREYGTVSNPIQLLPGSYQVTVAAIINGKRKSKSVGFDVETCTFNPTVVIKY